ncbi:hypothetical protein GCM10023318_17180 [Nocardia callitridis]|uniref:DNA-directed RNA polymerase subunit beta n=1 Tax=Nocardia callitridis TaxID=648753 RepID=A0ABP9K3V4_9NOCA
MNHIPFGDTPEDRCHYYRRVCDLPAVVEPPDSDRIMMRAGRVTGMAMPARFGHWLRTHLRDLGHATGPIVGHPRSSRWTFLVRPDAPNELSLDVEMLRFNVSIIRSGAMIALPSPTTQPGAIRQWIEPPRSTFRPSASLLITAVRASTMVLWHRASTEQRRRDVG